MNTLRQEPSQGIGTERSFVESCLPSTMRLRSHFVALLAEKGRSLPHHWPPCDRFFVALLPSLEKDVALFHAYPDRPALTDILKPHQIDRLDRDISHALQLLVRVAKQKSKEGRQTESVDVHAEQSLSCAVCDMVLTSNTKLLRHLRTEHRTTPAEYYEAHTMATKICSACHRVLPVQHFLRDRSNNYGHRAQCLHCMRPTIVTIACPICQRVVSTQAITTHMWTNHLVHPKDAYEKYLKQKYCPHCGEFKALDAFWPVDHPAKVCQPWCKRCAQDRYNQVMKKMVVRTSGKTGDNIDVKDLFALIENLDKLVKTDIATPLSPETGDTAIRQMDLNIC